MTYCQTFLDKHYLATGKAVGQISYLNSPRLLVTLCSGQKEALFSSTTISTLREAFPRPVDTTHSHSPLASMWTFDRISSLKMNGIPVIKRTVEEWFFWLDNVNLFFYLFFFVQWHCSLFSYLFLLFLPHFPLFKSLSPSCLI